MDSLVKNMCALEENFNDNNLSGETFIRMIDPDKFDIREEDKQFFFDKLLGFLSDEIYNSHTYYYDILHLYPDMKKATSQKTYKVGFLSMK